MSSPLANFVTALEALWEALPIGSLPADGSALTWRMVETINHEAIKLQHREFTVGVPRQALVDDGTVGTLAGGLFLAVWDLDTIAAVARRGRANRELAGVLASEWNALLMAWARSGDGLGATGIRAAVPGETVFRLDGQVVRMETAWSITTQET